MTLKGWRVVKPQHNQSNLDVLFTVTDSNTILSPYEILLIAWENKYLRIFRDISVFTDENNVLCTHHSIKRFIMKTSLSKYPENFTTKKVKIFR